ncbi:MAG: WD40 repeat domain-containing protein [Chloroflexia bacterium]
MQYGEDQLVALLAIHALNTEYTPEGDTALETAAALAYPEREFKGHERNVLSAAFSPDGKYVLTGSADKTARIWDAANGRELRVPKGHEEVINGVAYSHDGKYAATASDDHTARIWDAATG